MSLDKDRAKMLRAIRRKSQKRTTPAEQQEFARVVIKATAAEEIAAEAAKIRKKLTEEKP